MSILRKREEYGRSPTWESAWICTHDPKYEKKGREKQARKARTIESILRRGTRASLHPEDR